MKKVIITGVTGFFGASLTRTLLLKGVKVIGVDIATPKLEEFAGKDNFTSVIAGFEDYEKLADLIQDDDVDVFYHFAWAGGFTSAIRDYKLQMSNAGYAGDALVAAHKIGAKKFVYGIEYSAGLIPMPYGENNYSKQLVNIVLDCLNKKESPKLVEGNNLYDLVYIQDIVDALIAIGEKGKNKKEYYVGHRELKTFKEWITEIRDLVAPGVELKFGEYKDNQQINYSKVDLNALYLDTGWECKYELKDRIKNTAEWVKQNLM